MSDIFQSPYTKTESWSATGAIVNYGTGESAATAMPFLMLSITMNYQRTVQPYFPINTDATGQGTKINIGGAPRGTLTVQSIYSPTRTGLKAFIDAVAKACKTSADQVTMIIKPFGLKGCGSTNNTSNQLTLKGVQMQSVGLSIQGGQTAVCQVPTTYSFTSLDWGFA